MKVINKIFKDLNKKLKKNELLLKDLFITLINY